MRTFRLWSEQDEHRNTIAVGVQTLVEGERVSECFQALGPFDDSSQVLGELYLAERARPYQPRLPG